MKARLASCGLLVLLGIGCHDSMAGKIDSGDDARLKQRLTPLQYKVTREGGTEPPFQNEYWDNHREGIYVDIVSGEPLFSSRDKFDSGTGWPSFTRPLEAANITEHVGREWFTKRTEVRSKQGNAHLGHVFNDGPGPTGLRYCMNSAALKFIPVERLADEGYSQYLPRFQTQDRETAVLAGGCFWGVEEIIRQLPGVVETEAGYTGGRTAKPVYSDITTGKTGHAEAVKVIFDPAKISFAELLRYFFRLHDPTTMNRQGHDVGTQYRSAIFFQNENQRKIAEQVREEIAQSGKWKDPIVTEIVPAATFYPAEDDHQDYLKKHPDGYTCHYLRD